MKPGTPAGVSCPPTQARSLRVCAGCNTSRSSCFATTCSLVRIAERHLAPAQPTRAMDEIRGHQSDPGMRLALDYPCAGEGWRTATSMNVEAGCTPAAGPRKRVSVLGAAGFDVGAGSILAFSGRPCRREEAFSLCQGARWRVTAVGEVGVDMTNVVGLVLCGRCPSITLFGSGRHADCLLPKDEASTGTVSCGGYCSAGEGGAYLGIRSGGGGLCVSHCMHGRVHTSLVPWTG